MIVPDLFDLDGVPTLPSRYFYRVRGDAFGTLVVEVRRRGRLFSAYVTHARVWPVDFDDEDPEAVLADAAKIAYVKAQERIEEADMRAALAEYFGDHHPPGVVQ